MRYPPRLTTIYIRSRTSDSLCISLKEATEYKKPVIVKVAAVHNIAAIA